VTYPESWESAWEQCYAYFGLDDGEFDEQVAGLRLAFYLASFGMLRGSSKLRKTDLKGYDKLVKVCRNFKHLRDRKPEELAEQLCCVVTFKNALTESLFKLGVKPTATLVSKIALGTTACMPAYDRSAKIALKNLGFSVRPSREGLEQLYDGCRCDDLLEKLKAERNAQLPFMRELDIALWKLGQRIDEENRRKRERED
jgi:hypothetical protein